MRSKDLITERERGPLDEELFKKEAVPTEAKFEFMDELYIDILNEKSVWEQRFSDLKAEFKKRPAFLDEVRHI